MNKDLKQYIEKSENLILEHLRGGNISDVIQKSSTYSVEAGGKRFRPYLVFATLESFGVDPAEGLSAAAAVEMIHTYSLIHDDLPAMDDDDYRRGKPTNHKVYGEAAAILAGDNLLTESFNILAQDETLDAGIRIRLVQAFSAAAGQTGMIGGQMLDIEAEGKDITMDELVLIHRHKTGRLISAPIESAAIIAGADDDTKALLLRFAEYLGILFQIRDDILDVEGDMSKTGKLSGSDARKGKVTYVSAYGLSGAKEQLDLLKVEADGILESLSSKLDTRKLYSVLEMFAVREQ
ncbi:polyprenyl synthetase family protein [Salinicoccus carnicancri]|uniref:polyprenyl synthetase family protein n=1 Tax=Salinicoccus carnicancri TaxID=558170 RepID=UPI0002F61C8A|nr:farnesyl diphosphate synthase [Salinicoccus carnicancri]